MTQIKQMTTDLLFLLRGQWVNQKKEICGHLSDLCHLCAIT